MEPIIHLFLNLFHKTSTSSRSPKLLTIAHECSVWGSFKKERDALPITTKNLAEEGASKRNPLRLHDFCETCLGIQTGTSVSRLTLHKEAIICCTFVSVLYWCIQISLLDNSVIVDEPFSLKIIIVFVWCNRSCAKYIFFWKCNYLPKGLYVAVWRAAFQSNVCQS